MKEAVFSERYKDARSVGIGRLLSAYIATHTANISIDNVDTHLNETQIYRNAGLVEKIDPAKIVVPGI